MPDLPTQEFDLHVSARKVRHFAELDLGELVDLPTSREDMAALSLRMNAAFRSIWIDTFQLVAEDHEEISSNTCTYIFRELALGFIERYGALALFSSDLLKVLWSAQRLKSSEGSEFLRQVGQRLAVFVLAQKGWSPQREIDIVFMLSKPRFLAELEELSRELGALWSDEPWADQLLNLVRSGQYPMLKVNLRLLEEFLKCDTANCAERLAQYGARRLTSEPGPSITPDWFFYTWIGWTVNKAPGTVRRLIQSATTRFRSKISGYENRTKRNS